MEDQAVEHGVDSRSLQQLGSNSLAVLLAARSVSLGTYTWGVSHATPRIQPKNLENRFILPNDVLQSCSLP